MIIVLMNTLNIIYADFGKLFFSERFWDILVRLLLQKYYSLFTIQKKLDTI